ncbi:ribokinase [Roseateles sp. DC23W]|uniref:Ribokinase n=1 Tax=Pelomonas dachongensis TaxID=3299029 RepID=A0ABW7EUF6_9BURK
MSRSVLVAGSANLDFVVRTSHVPAPGETVLGRDFACFPGGKGANQALAAARAGEAPVRMLLALGQDAHAAPLEASLQDAGVQLHVVRDDAEPTGCAFITVSDNAENAITVAPGANNALRDEHLPSLKGVSHLLLQLEIPLDTVTAYARRAHAAGVAVVLNAAPARPLPAELLEAVDILVVNESELAAIAGTGRRVEAALATVEVPTVIVTLGSRGCLARHEGELIRMGVFPVHAMDTTAAGDTFCGVLVAALSRGDSLRAALRRAGAAAALACTRSGAQASVPHAREVDTLLAQQSATIPA